MQHTNRLYVIFHPTTALIGSQLDPENLARHYTAGPTRHYRGKVLFAGLDYEYRHPYFNIDDAIKQLVPHEDGRPKATKFISSYRVLEHIDPAALKNLYLTSPEGACLELEPGEYEPGNQDEGLKIYAEIDPLRMLVLSSYDFIDFGYYLTDPENPIGAPAFIYTNLAIDLDEFLKDFENNPFKTSPIPNLHPSILRDAISELRTVSYKNNKGLSLHSNLDNISYRLIKDGFMFEHHDGRRFYPMPSSSVVEERNLKFWRSM